VALTYVRTLAQDFDVPWDGWGSVCYCALAQSALNFTLTLWATKVLNQPTLVGAVQLLFPLFALVLAYFALHESLSPFAGVGGAIVIGGLLLVLRDRSAERREREALGAGAGGAYTVLHNPAVEETGEERGER
jgi:drug/metabolite transporter (DMT)-like permease